jgi:peroxiredoxin
MTRSVLTLCACAGVVLVGIGGVGGAPLLAAPGADDPNLHFRGAGSTRAALNAMQLKPFDQSLWSNLSNFTGAEFKKDELAGKVVLIVTWSSFSRYSHGAMKTAESLHEKYKDKGLVVIGVHNPRSAEGAAEQAKTLGLTFALAEDKDGKFRSGLKADQDPNVYVIDRAGNLRFAQVETSSMEEGVSYLVNETAEHAADYPKMLAKRAADTESEKWKTRDTTGLLRPNEEPTVNFPEPDEEAFKAVRWPYRVGKSETDSITDKTKITWPTLKAFPEDEWVPGTNAPKHAGKLLVIYYIDPKEVEMLETIPLMNRLYDKYHKDAVVCCSLFKLGAGGIGNTGNQNTSGGDGDDEKLKERNKELIPSILRAHPMNHYLNPIVLKAEGLDNPDSFQFLWDGKREDFGICIILSSDMKMRWFGNTHDPNLTVAVERIASVDPGVQARRRAEADAKAKAGK